MSSSPQKPKVPKKLANDILVRYKKLLSTWTDEDHKRGGKETYTQEEYDDKMALQADVREVLEKFDGAELETELERVKKEVSPRAKTVLYDKGGVEKPLDTSPRAKSKPPLPADIHQDLLARYTIEQNKPYAFRSEEEEVEMTKLNDDIKLANEQYDTTKFQEDAARVNKAKHEKRKRDNDEYINSKSLKKVPESTMSQQQPDQQRPPTPQRSPPQRPPSPRKQAETDTQRQKRLNDLEQRLQQQENMQRQQQVLSLIHI
jgi:hypothetical protein